MRKSQQEPKWVDNLRALIAHRKFNPRSLSLAAGLNATAVRDMLEGRAKFPRYDTVEALANALEVTPAQLMGGNPNKLPTDAANDEQETSLADDDLNLLTEIITRLQEAAQEHKHNMKPHDFAAMVTSIYRQINTPKTGKAAQKEVVSHIDHLMNYEKLRQRALGKK